MRLVSALGCLLLLTSTFLGCDSPTTRAVIVPTSPKQFARGEQLVKGLAACGWCHGTEADPFSPLAGGRAQSDRYGEVKAPNLTQDPSGLQGWQAQDVMEALRTGRARGRDLSTEVHRGYEWMSDADLIAIVAYLRALPPVQSAVERRDVGLIARNTTGMMEARKEVKGYVPEVGRRFAAEYGQYLTDHVARCGSCHNSESTFLSSEMYLAGGKTVLTPQGEKVAPNISSSTLYGVAGWTEEGLVHFLQSGERPDGSVAACPTAFYRLAPVEDLELIARYLKTVSPS